MPNLIHTIVDLGKVEIRDGEFEDDLLTFAAPGTLRAGTILARDSVSQKLIPFVKGGNVNQNGAAKAVLTYAVTATVAGDVPVRALIKGVVTRQRLVINADGDARNIDGNVLDQLRDFGIVPVDVAQLARIDNPQV